MFYQDSKLQYPVRVDTPNPIFARALQQAIGGVEGEIRVAMQYMFQAFGSRGPKKYSNLLLNTAAEELGHIQMLATAVALNLENAPLSMQEEMSADPISGSVLNGMNFRHLLSTGLAALPVNADGVPFDMSHVYASGNAAADMLANVTAEASGRVLATRLYNMTDDAGMKDMLSFLIARDTMHQQQWLAAIEDMGGLSSALPIPNSFPQSNENQEFSYAFLGFGVDDEPMPEGRWCAGTAMDGKGQFTMRPMAPLGQEPDLGMARPNSGAQTEQIAGSGSILNKILPTAR